MYDVTGLGELLIDFTPAGNSSAGNVLFERNPGGAPPNVLAAIARLGGRGAFIGKVGADQFGHFLKRVLDENNIESGGLVFSPDENTTLAFVHLDDKGDRSFSFYRKPGADTTLQPGEVDLELIRQSGIFHFGSLTLTAEPARSATLRALEYAKQQGKIVSYDPNWRPPLWESEAAAKAGMLLGLRFADIVKVSEEELGFLTGEKDLEKGSALLFDSGIRLVVVTLGPKGCFYRCAEGTGRLPTYDVKVVDTTGAGDAFFGGLLYSISKLGKKLEEVSLDEVAEMVDFSNAVGALCTTKRGGIPAMPYPEEVERCRKQVPRL